MNQILYLFSLANCELIPNSFDQRQLKDDDLSQIVKSIKDTIPLESVKDSIKKQVSCCNTLSNTDDLDHQMKTNNVNSKVDETRNEKIRKTMNQLMNSENFHPTLDEALDENNEQAPKSSSIMRNRNDLNDFTVVIHINVIGFTHISF